MDLQNLTIRNAQPVEFTEIGKLTARVYSQLDCFPAYQRRS